MVYLVDLEAVHPTAVAMGPRWRAAVNAARPLMGFGELNDNTIKGLTILLKLS
jgi:hypothetical protein